MADTNPEELAAEGATDPAPPEPEAPSVSEGAETASGLVRVRAVRGDYYNPFTRQMFRQYEEVEAAVDGFLQSQLDAGYIEKV